MLNRGRPSVNRAHQADFTCQEEASFSMPSRGQECPGCLRTAVGEVSRGMAATTRAAEMGLTPAGPAGPPSRCAAPAGRATEQVMGMSFCDQLPGLVNEGNRPKQGLGRNRSSSVWAEGLTGLSQRQAALGAGQGRLSDLQRLRPRKRLAAGEKRRPRRADAAQIQKNPNLIGRCPAGSDDCNFVRQEGQRIGR